MADPLRAHFFEMSPPVRVEEPKGSPCQLILAPFSPIGQLDFVNVKIGSSSVESIRIFNPTSVDVKICLVAPKDFQARGFTLGAETLVVPKTSDATISLEWRPITDGKWRDTINVKQCDGSRRYSNIVVSSSAVPVKKRQGRVLRAAKRNVENCASQRRQTYDVAPSQVTFAWTSPLVDKTVVVKTEKLDSTYELTHSPNLPKLAPKIEPIDEIDQLEMSAIVLEQSLGVPESRCLKNIQNTLDLGKSQNTGKTPNSPMYSSTPIKPYQIDASPPVVFVKPFSRNAHPNKETQRKLLYESRQSTSSNASTAGTPAKRKMLNLSAISAKKMRMPSPSPERTYLFPTSSLDMTKEDLEKQYSELYQTTSYNINNYGLTTINNPFSRNALHPEQLLDKIGLELIKWLNSILTIPEELSHAEVNVDLALLWKKAVASDVVPLAPSKETISNEYHRNETHLFSLRKAAIALFRSESIGKVLYSINTKVQNDYFSSKDDVDLYHDQGIRYKLLELVMSYNPLWLRIGLEAIYGEPIKASPTNLVRTLVVFLKNNFLSDKAIIEKNSYSNINMYKMPTFKSEMNRFIIAKFLTLVFFLDQAKMRRLIPYDPCLFRKQSPIKESEGMLNEFIKDFIKCVGHMKTTLKHLGYILTYKQRCLEEFDYSVTSHLDLREGVHLTRAVEIILKDNSLSKSLRVPSVSRLQKVHNVKIALDALTQEGFEIEDVTSKDVVNGHKEKIFSLLWQILHKFLAPRYEAAAQTVQTWWRNRSLKREIQRRIVVKREKAMQEAAVKIQSWWKGCLLRKRMDQIKASLIQIKEERTSAAGIIQRWYRRSKLMQSEVSQFKHLKLCVVNIQRRYRSKKLMQTEVIKYQNAKSAVIKIQQWYRSSKLMQKEAAHYQSLRSSSITIQRWYRSIKLMQYEVAEYQKTKTAAVTIQRWYRSIKLMQNEVSLYQKKRSATIKIQRWYRSTKKMQSEVRQFKHLKLCVINIQRRYRSNKMMQVEVVKYQNVKSSVVKIQQWYRCSKLMQKEAAHYQSLRSSSITIQRWYRNIKLMQNEVAQYQKTKTAAVTVQRWYRSVKLMQNEVSLYQKKRSATIKIQRWYRSTKKMQSEVRQFKHLKLSVINIQRRYRSNKLMQAEVVKYQNVKSSVVKIQQWYRCSKLMQKEAAHYQSLRSSSITIQRWYRSIKLMQYEVAEYQKTKTAAVTIQRWYRSVKLMQNEVSLYQKKRSATINIQRWYRSTKMMQSEVRQFKHLKLSVINIQRRYRSNKLMQAEVVKYQNVKSSVIKIQQWYRCSKLMQKEAAHYQSLRSSSITIQRWYRSIKLMQNEVAQYQKTKTAAVTIQRWYRNIKLMENEVALYQKTRSATIKIQRWYRSTKMMQSEVSKFKHLKLCVINIQRRYRSNKLMQAEVVKYQNVKSSVVKIQQWYRCSKLMQKEAAHYQSLRSSSITMQRWYRSIKLMQIEVAQYQKTKTAAVTVQRWYRNIKLMENEVALYQKTRSATIKIQRWYRSTKMMQSEVSKFKHLKLCVINIQRRYRSNKLMRAEVVKYQNVKSSVVKIQQWYRCSKLMQKEAAHYQSLRSSSITIQRWYRNIKLMQNEVAQYQKTKTAAVTIQRWYRSVKLMQNEVALYQKKRTATIQIQRWYRRSKWIKQMAALAHQNQEKAALVIQALWKGYRLRKTHKFVPKIVPQYSEPKQKNVTLASRFHSLIISLQTRKMNVILVALAQLDYIIQHAPALSLPLMEIEEIHNLFYYTLNVGCRSTPYQRAFSMIINILLNASLCERAVALLWEHMKRSGLLVLLNVLKFYKSNIPLFLKTVTLLWIICQDQQRAKELASTPELESKLRFYYSRISKEKNPKRILPRLKPNCGYGENKLEFLSPQVALEELAKVLKINF